MTEEIGSEDDRKRRFYDVQRVITYFDSTRVKPTVGRFSRLGRAVWQRFDAVQGLGIVFSVVFFPFIFAMALVVMGLTYGPLAFLVGTGGLLLVLGLIIERKVGPSLVFAEYRVFRRVVAQGIAFAAFAGIILLLLLVNGSV